VAWSFVGYTTATPDGTTSVTVSVPSGVQNGDFLLLALVGYSSGVPSVPSGWTVLYNESLPARAADGFILAWRVASSEPASYTITDSSSIWPSAVMYAVRGGASSSPVAGYSLQTSSSYQTTLNPPSYTQKQTGSLLIYGFGGVNSAGSGGGGLVLPSPASMLAGSSTGDVNNTHGGSDLGVLACTATGPGPATITTGVDEANSVVEVVPATTAVTGTGSVGMPAAGVAGTGTVANPVTGTGTGGLAALGVAGTGTVANPVTGTGSVGMPALGAAGTGSNGISLTVLQTVNGGVQDDYGLDSVPFSLRQPGRSALVVFAAWNLAHGTDQMGAAVPAVNVTDSASNLWYQIGISPPMAGARCAIWVAPTARQVEWVSVALTGWAYATSYTVCEVTGLPPLPVVDFTVTTSNPQTSTLTLSGVTSESSVAFAAACAGDISVTMTTPPAGWAQITDHSIGTSPYGAQIWSYWQTTPTAPGATVDASWTLSAGVPAAAVLACIHAAPAIPQQISPDFPLLQLEAAFGATPGDPSASVDYTWDGQYTGWTDITTRALDSAGNANITYSMGRSYGLAQEEAGTLECALSNVDGAFTPGNTASPYYSNALNPNMGMEAGTEGWSGQNGATITTSSQYAYTGSYSLQVTPDGTTAYPGVWSVLVPVNVNYPYSVSAWFYCPTGYAAGAEVNILWYDAAQAYLSTSSPPQAVPLPAGQWTQVTFTGVTPPAGAAYAALAAQLSGTPPASAVFCVDEAAITTGSSAVKTGLVTLETPVRLTCWWNGTRYPLWMGYVESWPQEWPHMPQWGFSKMTATDAVGVLSSAYMYSAVEGEVLTAQPYAYFPCNEQYSLAEEGLYTVYIPADAGGLTAVNYATGNTRTAIYLDGESAQVNTGMAVNLLGDSATGMGTSSYQAQDQYDRGPALVYTDPDLPVNSGSNGFTVEFWFIYTDEFSKCTILSLWGGPSAFIASTAPYTAGGFFNVDFNNAGPGTLNIGAGTDYVSVPGYAPAATPQHLVITFPPGGGDVTVFLNGVETSTTVQVPAIQQLQAVILGPGRYAYDVTKATPYYAFNFTAAHLAVYGYVLTPTQVANHYEAGAAGWAGATGPLRYAQVLTWARVGMKRGGPAWFPAYGWAETTRLSEAYQMEGSSVADILAQVTGSEGGRCYVQPNGSVTYLQRWSGYNRSGTVILGDNPQVGEIPMEPGVSYGFDNTYLYNEVTSTQERGPAQYVTITQRDPASQGQFFNRSALSLQSYVVSPYDVGDVVTWNLARYKNPFLYVKQISVEAASKPQLAFPALLAVGNNDVVTTSRRPLGGAPITQTGVIQKVSTSIGPGTWHITYTVWPYTADAAALQSDVAPYSQLGGSNLPW